MAHKGQETHHNQNELEFSTIAEVQETKYAEVPSNAEQFNATNPKMANGNDPGNENMTLSLFMSCHCLVLYWHLLINTADDTVHQYVRILTEKLG